MAIRKDHDIRVRFKSQFNEIDKSSKKGADELRKFKKEAKETGVEIEKSARTAKKRAKDFEDVGTKASKGANKATNSFKGLNSILTRFVGFAAITAGITTFLRANAQFEQKMSDISTLLIGQEDDVARLKEGILDLSEVYPKDANELGAAAYNIVSAGIEGVNNQLEALEASTKLAIGGLGTTEQAVDLVTSSLNAFKQEGLTAAEVSETLFRAVKNGKTTVADLAQGFGGVAGTVAATGISFKEFIAQVTALTTVGLPASQAYTQLRAVIAGLTRDTEQSREVFQKLGAENLPDLIKKSGGFTEALKGIVEATGGNQAELLKLVGSTEALNAIIGLTGPVAEAFNSTLANMNETIGELDQAVAKQNQTLQNQWQILKNQVNRAMIDLGEKILPTVIEGLGGITSGAEDSEASLSGLQKTTTVVAGALRILFATIVLGITAVVEVFRFMANTFTKGLPAIGNLFAGVFFSIIEVGKGAFETLFEIFEVFGSNLASAIENPLSAAKVAFAGAINFFIRKINTFTGLLDKAFQKLPETLKNKLGITGINLEIKEIEVNEEDAKKFKSVADIGAKLQDNFNFEKASESFKRAQANMEEFEKSATKGGLNIADAFADLGIAAIDSGKDISQAFDDEYQQTQANLKKLEKQLEDHTEAQKQRKRDLVVTDQETLQERVKLAEEDLIEQEKIARERLKQEGRTQEEIETVLEKSLKSQREVLENARKDLTDAQTYKADYSEMEALYEKEADAIKEREVARERAAAKLESDLILQGKSEEEIRQAKADFYKVEQAREEERAKKFREFQEIQTAIATKGVEYQKTTEETTDELEKGGAALKENEEALNVLQNIQDKFGDTTVESFRKYRQAVEDEQTALKEQLESGTISVDEFNEAFGQTQKELQQIENIARDVFPEIKQNTEDAEKAQEKMAKEIAKAFDEYEDGVARSEKALEELEKKQNELLANFEKEIRNVNNAIAESTGKAQGDLAKLVVDSQQKTEDLKKELAKAESDETRKELQAEIDKLKQEIAQGKKFLDEISGGRGDEIVKAEEEQQGKTEAEKIKENFEAEKAVYEERKAILEALKNGEQINLEEIQDYKNREYALEQQAKIEALNEAKDLEIKNRKEVEREFIESIKKVEATEIASIQRRSDKYAELIDRINQAIRKYQELESLNEARANSDPPKPAIPVYHTGGEVKLGKREGLAKLEDEEFVVRRDVAQANLPFLKQLNSGKNLAQILAKTAPRVVVNSSAPAPNQTSQVYNDKVEIRIDSMPSDPYDIYTQFLIPRRNF